MPVLRDKFRWISGETALEQFESSPGKLRRFCKRCGSQIVAERVGEPTILLRLGCLDTPIVDRPAAHIWRSEGAAWYDPRDQIPEFTAGVRKAE